MQAKQQRGRHNPSVAQSCCMLVLVLVLPGHIPPLEYSNKLLTTMLHVTPY
jgi:hypothetical protein